MIDILLCYRRRRGLRRSGFRRYWKEERKPLVRALQASLGFPDYAQLRRSSRLNLLYVGIRLSRSWPFVALLSALQRRRIPPLFPGKGGAHEHWDVVETFTYASLEAAVTALSSPDGRAALARLRDDAEALVGNGAAVAMDRHPVHTDKALGHPRTATLFFLRARAPMTGSEMLEYWGGSHRALVEALAPAMGHRIYDQLHPTGDGSTVQAIEAFGGSQTDPFDGVARLCYRSQWTLIRRLIDPRLHIANVRLVRDELGFVELGASALVFGTEEGL